MEENKNHKNWFGRNWKWAVPTGGCLLIILLIIAFAGTLIFGVSNMMSDSQAHIDAMTKALTNPTVVERLGQPIVTNGMGGGSVNYSNGYGKAELTIPIKGPKGEGTIRVEGEGMDSKWTYSNMKVYIIDTKEIIDLQEANELLD